MLWDLNNLSHEIFQATMISKNDEVVAEEIVLPFADRGCNCDKFPNISGGSLESGTKQFTKKGYGV